MELVLRNLLPVLFFCLFSFSVFGEGITVGIASFSNQRIEQSDDWIGHYIKARLLENLKLSSTWHFLSYNAVEHWKLSSQNQPNNLPAVDVFIQGEFQKVLNRCYLVATMHFPGGSGSNPKNIEKYFTCDSIEKEVDQLSFEVGRQIDVDYTEKIKGRSVDIRNKTIKRVLQYAANRWNHKGVPDKNALQILQKEVTVEHGVLAVSELVLGMIILSQSLDLEERQPYLKHAESILRKALLKYNKNALLHALFSETLYLLESYPQWIEKEAVAAVSQNPYNELGLLMLAVARREDPEKRDVALRKLEKITPWIWRKPGEKGVAYQNGIFDTFLNPFSPYERKKSNAKNQH